MHACVTRGAGAEAIGDLMADPDAGAGIACADGFERWLALAGLLMRSMVRKLGRRGESNSKSRPLARASRRSSVR